MRARPARVALFLALATAPVCAAAPSLEQRIDARRAVEEVLWSRRQWPATNPVPKPPLDRVLPASALRRRVTDALAASDALARRWGREISRAALQAELDRMAASTRDPALLRALFAALGDDPERIAEVLVRPVLADRRIREAYARDERLHAAARARAERSRAEEPEALARLADDFAETLWVEDPGRADEVEEPDGVRVVRLPGGAEWESLAGRLAGWFGVRGAAVTAGRDGAAARLARVPVGVVSPVQETDDRFFVVRVLEREPSRVRILAASFHKVPFDAWWAEHRASFVALPAAPDDGAPGLTLPAITGNPCTDDTWSGMRSGDVPEERESHTAVWTGTEMIVWGGAGVGGALATGARYVPATDAWAPIASAGAPSARWRHTAVWTGSEMIVWGGGDALDFLSSGGRYDPTTEQWSATSTGADVPQAREGHTAVWTGARMIVWGGDETLFNLDTGGVYDPAADAWTSTSRTGAPLARYGHSAVWTGAEMVVWGGVNDDAGPLATGARYDPLGNAWLATAESTGTPSARSTHTAVWTGAAMLVWGGAGAGGYVSTGARYDPAADSWAPIAVDENTPSARYSHTAVWTGTEMLVWGGYESAGYTGSGGRYDPTADSWQPIVAGLPAPSARARHTAVWTGDEMIVWGGYAFDGADHVFDSGGRYLPSTGAWAPTSAWAERRRRHSAIWTGAEVIVWGGDEIRPPDPSAPRGSGGRYLPATDQWLSVGAAGAPSPRERHTAVWTGTEMIVWGGVAGAARTSAGGRYDPLADTWTPTAVGAGTPSPRYLHTAVWTGADMLVWGGWDGAFSATGARYSPASDAWTSLPAGPVGRYGHTAVWTGDEMVVWGGRGATGYLFSGSRLRSSPPGWSDTSTASGVPSGRAYHSAVWTGAEMIVWGGMDGVADRATGARYLPASDEWIPLPAGTEAPPARAYHTAVWTGGEMIVWGGSVRDPSERFLDDGARFRPALDAWSAVTHGPGVPSPRDMHTAVSAGDEMIVWGGRDATSSLGTGGRYCSTFCATPAPAGSPTVALARAGTLASISWATLAGATSYDVVRGALATLLSSGGDFTAATTACLADDTAARSVEDAAVPAAAAGFWYLVRGVSCGGAGTYDGGGSHQAGSRDAEIEAAAASCP